MRPNLPDSLAERVKDIYQEAGYSNATELVNDSIRRRLEELEEKHD